MLGLYGTLYIEVLVSTGTAEFLNANVVLVVSHSLV